MPFQPSSLRFAGQDSDTMDMFFPSSEAPLGPLASPVSAKQMYGNNEAIESWIDSINRANKSTRNPRDPKYVDTAFEFATHPFRTCLPHTPFSDEFESDSDVSFCFAAYAWAPNLPASPCYDESDESLSESLMSDDAQYITIPSNCPWHWRPSPSSGPVSVHELSTAGFAHSCSSDVRQAIAQQELLLAIFHEELRRIVPRADGMAYDSDWLEGVDADLVLAPLETYADLCWDSAVCEKSPSSWLPKPTPDVPDDIY